MRLTQDQQAAILSVSAEFLGGNTDVWLFGSRVDDSKRGGDIDILLDVPEPVENPALLAARLSARLTRLMHGRKVDVLLSAPNLLHLPIHDIAFREGKKL